MKGCLDTADMKGPVLKECKHDPTDRGPLNIGELCSASLFFDNDTHILVCLT